MSRYIDANALKPDYIVGSTSTNTECYKYVSLKQIVNAPTADVVEVVRCKDCAIRYTSCPMVVRSGLVGVVTFFTEDDDYCSQGVAKGEKNENKGIYKE